MKVSSFILAIMAMAILASCLPAGQAGYDDQYEFALIETTGNENTGHITFRNVADDKESGIELDLGGILPWNSHKTYRNFVYLGANGLDTQKDSGTVLEINKESKEIVKYKIWDKPITAIAVADDKVFVAGNLNNVYQIAAYNKETETTAELELKDSLILYMEAYGDRLYAFSSVLGSNPNTSLLYVIDISRLEVMEIIDISSCGSLQLGSCMIEGILYFTSNRSIDDGMSTDLYGLDTASREIFSYDIKNPFPFQIEERGGQLFISHYDPVNLEGNGLTVFDLETKEPAFYTLSGIISQFEIYEDQILTASFPGSGRNEAVLHAYRLDDLELLHTVPLELNHDSHYFVSFFTR